MATADGFVQPAVPSLDNVVRPGRGGMDVPHGWREITIEAHGVVVYHQSVQRRVQLYQGVRLQRDDCRSPSN